jgi:hypothetical protein
VVGLLSRAKSARCADQGFQSAFVACVVLAGIGVTLALALLGRPHRAPHKRRELAPATGTAD